MNNWCNLDTNEAGVPKHLVRLSSDEQINPVAPGVSLKDYQQPVPRGRWWITERCAPVNLMAGHEAAGPGQGDHLFHDLPRFGYVD